MSHNQKQGNFFNDFLLVQKNLTMLYIYKFYFSHLWMPVIICFLINQQKRYSDPQMRWEGTDLGQILWEKLHIKFTLSLFKQCDYLFRNVQPITMLYTRNLFKGPGPGLKQLLKISKQQLWLQHLVERCFRHHRARVQIQPSANCNCSIIYC